MGQIPVRHIYDNQTENFSIRDLGIVLDGKSLKEEIHRHDYYFVMFFEKGSGTHEIDFVNYPITDNCLFILRPGQVHQMYMEAGCTGYLLQFNTEYFFPFDKAAGKILNCYQPDESSFKPLSDILRYVYQEYRIQKSRYLDIIKAQMSSFMIALLRENPATPVDQTNLYRQERLDQLMVLLEQHILTHKQVSDYAKMMNLSVYQLNAIIKSALNKTCSELINEQIILEAKRRLLATPDQINQIGYDLGYEDISYFTRFFKRHTGYAPEAFRQKIK